MLFFHWPSYILQPIFLFIISRIYIFFLKLYFYIIQYHSIMGDSSASYIHMVQHLIEKCLIFNMSKEECMEALFEHANIKPVITSTVWNELEKENKEFFEAYSRSQNKEDQMSETKSSAMVQKTISDPDHNPGPDPDHDHDQENPKDSK